MNGFVGLSQSCVLGSQCQPVVTELWFLDAEGLVLSERRQCNHQQARSWKTLVMNDVLVGVEGTT